MADQYEEEEPDCLFDDNDNDGDLERGLKALMEMGGIVRIDGGGGGGDANLFNEAIAIPEEEWQEHATAALGSCDSELGI